MSLNIVGLVDTIRDRFAEFMRDRRRYIPADDQARLSWASVAKTRAEVPEMYHEFFDALPVEDKDPFPYTVISPTYKGFIQPENEKVICRVGDSLCILEQKERRIDFPAVSAFGDFSSRNGNISFCIPGSPSAGRIRPAGPPTRR